MDGPHPPLPPPSAQPQDERSELLAYLKSIRSWLVVLTLVVLAWTAVAVVVFVLFVAGSVVTTPDPENCIYTEVGGVYQKVCE